MKFALGIVLVGLGLILLAFLIFLLFNDLEQTKFFSFLIDAWEFIGLSFTMLLLGIILIMKYK
jgi:hypothetical protein